MVKEINMSLLPMIRKLAAGARPGKTGCFKPIHDKYKNDLGFLTIIFG
ncbi:hypothetical protein [Bacillus sp. FJAT-27231]|nr:hypothetical protein [Bacillus sp. FJAT-27231]